MGPGIAARPHCAERRICRCSRLGHQTRRPKDPSSILAHQLRRRFPSRRSEDPVPCSVQLPREPRPPISLHFRPKASATSMFRGPSWAGSLLRGLSPWGGNCPRNRKHQLFRRLLPTGPEIRSLRHRPEGQFSFEPHSIACRRRSVLPSPSASFLPLPAFRGGGDFRPDHELNLHKDSESRKAKNEGWSLWITGISGVSRDSRAGIPPNMASRGRK